MKSRAAIAARRLARQNWIRLPSVLSSPEPAEAKEPHSARSDASIREHDTVVILFDVGLAN
ncbi:MAG: hypothetical protein HOQ07_07100 [Sinomonas sp.]|nr:hypothetical protein [Sinomonas sp.]